MNKEPPEKLARSIIAGCTDCDDCRYLMDTACFFFPELFRLHDKYKDKETDTPITPAELRHLVDLCNFCGLCPCPNVRTDIMNAKTAFTQRDGLPPTVRLLEDVRKVSQICGAYPRLANRLSQSDLTGPLLKRAAGIHPKRNIPLFPEQTFPDWMNRRASSQTATTPGSPHKVIYFAGCTAQYLFPAVARSAVKVLEKNGIQVHFPKQQCCGMPPLLEGDRERARAFASFNLDRLSEAVDDGYEIVCSCPTCGYMLKHVLKERAYYSEAYQATIGGDKENIKVPVNPNHLKDGFKNYNKSIYASLLKDDGYFSDLDPLKRIKVAEHTHDLGDYLKTRIKTKTTSAATEAIGGHAVYFPPCHLREQKIGLPYLDLMERIPGLTVTAVNNAFYCCGIAGIMGFKKVFHEVSIGMGRQLMDHIESIRPDMIITDCLSCRLQFQQMSDYPVYHPIEFL